MSTLKQLADYLGVSEKTLNNNKKLGYSVVTGENRKLDVRQSAHAFVKFQSDRIRTLSKTKSLGSKGSGKDEDDETKGLDHWKTERERLNVEKLSIGIDKDLGFLVPSSAMLEIYGGVLKQTQNHLLKISSKAQKRSDEFNPKQLRIIDDLVMDALHGLREKPADELKQYIAEIIGRYSKYHRSDEEDSDIGVDETE